MPSQTAFISGPINTGPNEAYFHSHYPPLLTAAIARNDSFVLGPLPYGVDSDALSYLLQYPVSPTKITVFVTSQEDGLWGLQLRALGVNIHVVEGNSTRDRDAAMTAASTYDILRIRPEEEAREVYGELCKERYVTNTERNWRRRRGMGEDEKVEAEVINGDVRAGLGVKEKKRRFLGKALGR
ncbi:hypothetical protein AtubIFM56815_009242 [Aspergillus tubingensis]|uniref:Uncharacterized protein n=1 Tax=Aspergillus tubingensis TaxID=5068 RepID=A0A8H3SL83_ASPTU|nr:similar to An12g07300 [Aspergillus tubingensis]GFN11702.1 similar to An12g07300 [Aspergillus tubingensis]GLA66789.1 hypothetical protein AtubIFM54640_009375 [Aspergillus tubingensis]GLA85018.1 hypothetical protein AtubIFM56815_009242 [Aspergillus tubingensis]